MHRKYSFVHPEGLEPPRLSASDPKSEAAANFAKSAFRYPGWIQTTDSQIQILVFYLLNYRIITFVPLCQRTFTFIYNQTHQELNKKIKKIKKVIRA